MGDPYKLAFYFKLQIGVCIDYSKDFEILSIRLPFISISISFDKNAHGIRFFKD